MGRTFILKGRRVLGSSSFGRLIKSVWRRALIDLLLIIGPLLIATTDCGSYCVALTMEPLWLGQGVNTRGQLERRLFFTRSRQIDPADSMWGHVHRLKPGEQMIQYGIMWNFDCPLDVVYDSLDRIVQIYTSYE